MFRTNIYKSNRRNLIVNTIAFVFIILIFNYTYGLEIIVPTNINWLLSARHDWGQHYLGWAFYRNEPWMFPLGKIESLSYPVSTNVGFWDAIPGVALSFKLLSPILPNTFQYYGIWMLLCHLLTAFYTIKILQLYKVKSFYVVLIAVLVGFNPILVYRAMHPALCSHFLILASIYLYLKPANTKNVFSINQNQLIVISLSALVNPYICFMVSAFSILVPFKHYYYDKLISLKKYIFYIGSSVILVLVIWYIIGMISFGKNSSLEVSDSYGLYSFNLNSFVNSFGFSSIFPKKPWVSDHQYEGFMYLGLGFAILLAISLFLFITVIKPLKFIKNNRFIFPLILLCLFITVFAVTDKVTYNDTVLFNYSMPKIIRIIGNIFRATSRFMWVVYYVVLLFFIIVFLKVKLPDWIKSVILIIIIGFQFYDLQSLYAPRNYSYGTVYDTPLDEEKWNTIIPSFKRMITYPPFNNHLLNNMDYQDLCYLALQNSKDISTGYSAREDFKADKIYTDSLKQSLEGGKFSSEELYITTPGHLNVFNILLENNSLSMDYLDGYYILYDKKKSIKFDRDISVIYKEDSIGLGSNSRFIEKQNILNLDNDSLSFKLKKLITNLNTIYVSGSASINKEVYDGSIDSVFVTISNKNRLFITQTEQIRNENTAKDVGFSAIISTQGVEHDSLTLGVTIKNNDKWFYKSIGKLSEIQKTTKFIKKDDLPSQKEQIGNIDEYINQSSSIKISGWTILKRRPSINNKIEVAFIDNNRVYIFATDNVIRNDVTRHFDNKYNYDNSGFSTLINKQNIPKGNYTIGIVLRNEFKGEESLMMTDKKVKIE